METILRFYISLSKIPGIIAATCRYHKEMTIELKHASFMLAELDENKSQSDWVINDVTTECVGP